ncbi:hypothetical protein AWENTII_005991 [Aspergillus wentii]
MSTKPSLDLSSHPPDKPDHVYQLAAILREKTSVGGLQRIETNLQNMTAEEGEYLASKNMDPMTYFCQTQDLNSLRGHQKRLEKRGRSRDNLILRRRPQRHLGDCHYHVKLSGRMSDICNH